MEGAPLFLFSSLGLYMLEKVGKPFPFHLLFAFRAQESALSSLPSSPALFFLPFLFGEEIDDLSFFFGPLPYAIVLEDL